MNDLTLNENTSMQNNSAVARSEKEVEGQIVMAKKFPRDMLSCIQRIKDNCKRRKLAEKAMYAYPRGGQMVTGPSIRLAEVIAQSWGNISFGVREVSSMDGESLIEAFAWDLETNVRQSKSFKVPHIRYSKQYGNKKLIDPRDIYEMVANQGARRLRSCILGVIPLDIVEEATEECTKTLANQNSEPIQDRISKMLQAFTNQFQVTKEMLEARLGHDLAVTSEMELIDLRKIFNSLKDKMSKRGDWFDFKEKVKSESSNKLNSLSKAGSTELEIQIDKQQTDEEKAFQEMGNALKGE